MSVDNERIIDSFIRPRGQWTELIWLRKGQQLGRFYQLSHDSWFLESKSESEPVFDNRKLITGRIACYLSGILKELG